MTEEQVFLAALDQPDASARAAYLDETCGGDAAFRQQVEGLLAAHFQSGEFLDVPAVEQLNAGSNTEKTVALQGDSVSSTNNADDESEGLHFLTPSTRPDSLGRLGHYEVLQVLGKGGFGIVFRAFDDVLQRVVAIKVLAPQMAATSPARKRFLREARSSAQVRHENVVQVHAVEEQPLPYLVMEFIPGETLQQRLDRVGPLDVPETLRIGRQIAEGLAAAHANDLIHRDIKPGNVLLEGGQHRAKITDFGLARAADDASISQTGIIAGTPMYMAPEQAEGQPIDQRADLFSFGSVLYQMVAGRPPFRANTTVAVLKRVACDTPRAIREIIPETPQWLCDIIAKLHAKNPDDRYQSAREVADVLADCEAQLKANSKLKDFSRIPQSKSPAKSSGRKQWAAAAAILLLPMIVLAVTEFAGVTHLFRGQQANHNPIDTSPPISNEMTNRDVPATDGWAQLFNGKDLTGWKTHPQQPGTWEVKDGILVGSTRQSYLFTDRDDFKNFHLRAELKINAGGDTGIRFHAPFTLLFPKQAGWGVVPAGGYEVEFTNSATATVQTGTIRRTNPPERVTTLFRVEDNSLTHPGEWQKLEVIVSGNRTIVKIDGRDVADGIDAQNMYSKGHIALQCYSPQTVVQFRKVEIKEMPSSEMSLPPTFKNSIGLEFVIVPKGRSWLGGDKDRLGDKEVEIPADFYLGKYEVTQEEWTQVMGENPSHFSRTGGGKDVVKVISDAELKRFPVENVSWDQCQIFVAKLNKLETETGWIYRLPKEAEWEYACRGGPMSDKLDSAFDFYFAKPTNTLSQQQANYGGDRGLTRTRKGGFYEANRLGLFDMHGNVLEWCDDLVDAADKASPRVYRGGGWANANAWECAAAIRNPYPPPDRSWNLGLRLARVPAGAASPEAKTPPLAVAPFTDADVKRIAALPAAEQVEEVRKELMRRNAGFDGNFEHKIKDNVVIEFKIVTDQVTDIAPIRVFNALRVLDLYATHTNNYKGNGQLADLSPLAGMNLAGLTRLNLSFTMVGDAGLVHFKDCTNLTYLNLDSTQVTDAGLAYFKNCTNLSQLLLGRTKINDAGLAHFKNCKKLTLLDLSEVSVGDAELGYFNECEHLTRLGLGRTLVTDAGLAHFKNCKKLQHVNLLGTMVGNVGLAYLKDCKELTGLFIGSTKVTDLSLIKDLPLKDLDFDFRPERDAESLRSIKTLETINGKPAAEFWKEFDEQAASALHETWLKGMPLTRLTLFSRQVRSCEPLKGLPLTTLGLAYCSQIQDFTPLKDLPLTGLLLNDCNVRDLEPFKDLKLTGLYLAGTPVRDLELLKGMPLKKLSIFQKPGVTDLRPLQGMELEEIYLTPKNITQGLDILRDMQSLKTIGIDYNQAWPAAEFWDRYDKGEFKK